MSQVLPQQHPAVVLRSQYVHLRTVLAIAMIAVVVLAAAVIVLATDGGSTPAPAAAKSSTAPSSATQSVGTTRYDGGPDEGTRGPDRAVVPVSHYDGPH